VWLVINNRLLIIEINLWNIRTIRPLHDNTILCNMTIKLNAMVWCSPRPPVMSFQCNCRYYAGTCSKSLTKGQHQWRTQPAYVWPYCPRAYTFGLWEEIWLKYKCQKNTLHQMSTMPRSLTLSQNTATVQATAVMLSLPRNSKNEPMLFSTNICILLPLMKLYACQTKTHTSIL